MPLIMLCQQRGDSELGVRRTAKATTKRRRLWPRSHWRESL